MKIFDSMQSFFSSIGEYVKNYSNLFFIFLGAFLLLSVIIIVITSFAYECQLTKTIDKINKFLERNPRINDDNLVAFNNLMKAGSVPKTLRRQWQQFMLYREHPASYYMSFKHCVENPLRNSVYKQQMVVYRVISFVLIVLSFVASAFMTVHQYHTNLVLQDVLIIPITILILYWLVSMVLDLIHSAVSSDLFQNYQYFEINMDKAMLTLPEFVDYEVLFSQDEIRRGIPVLYAYLQKRAIQEQQELEKARIKSVDHEKFDFDEAGLDGSLVLDRAMRETENFTSQRKKYMQETERVNNEISVLENNYKEQVKEYQRQVQTSKETVDNLKEQLEQATSTIEINYIKKQMRDEINRQQLAEKDFDILTDKHNQEIKSLNQEIKHYEDETQKAKEALEEAMLSEFNTYSIKVYNNLEKIVDDKMQGKVEDYKGQIKGLEGQLEEKNEELENVYTRYQEVLSQTPAEIEEPVETYTELPLKKGKKKKKDKQEDQPADDGMVQPEQLDEMATEPYYDDYDNYDDENYDNTDYNYDNQDIQNDEYLSQDYQYDESHIPTEDVQYDDNYVPVESQEYYSEDNYDNQYTPIDETQEYNDTYIPLDEGADQGYVPLSEEDNQEYVPLTEENNQEYVPLDNSYEPAGEEYVPLDADMQDYDVMPDTYMTQEEENNQDTYVPTYEEAEYSKSNDIENEQFDDSDFDIDFSEPKVDVSNFDNMDFGFDISDEKTKTKTDKDEAVDDDEDGEFDLNDVLGLYDMLPETKKDKGKKSSKQSAEDLDDILNKIVEEDEISKDNGDEDFNINIEDEINKEDNVDIESVITDDELSAPAPTKRKAGRPRKIVDESEIKPKRSVGRPRKIVEEDETVLDKPKRKAGRPRKIVVESQNKPKRSVGRPRKIVDESEAILDKPKRKAGRPRKQNNIKKRSVGRPRKQEEPTKRPVGRPKAVVKNRVGRPRKQDKLEANATKRPVGRPRKIKNIEKARRVGRPRKDQKLSIDTSIKSKRGRPRKNAQ